MQPLHQAEQEAPAAAFRGNFGADTPGGHPLPGHYSAGTTFAPDSLSAASAAPPVREDPVVPESKDNEPQNKPASYSVFDSDGPGAAGPSFMADTQANPASDEPMPVVRVLSVRGVEYGMMTIALWVAASTAAWIVLNMLNGSGGFDAVVVPVSSLVICLPVFGLLFLRLKKAELAQPSLRMDPSKRRWSQTTQFLAFIGLLINFIYFVYVLLQHASGGHGPSVGKSVLSLAVVTVIAGGVLAYYWHDEHRLRKG